MTLLAFAADCRAAVDTRRAAIDRCRLPAGPTAVNPPHAETAAQDGADRRTDATPDRFIDPAPHTMRALSIRSTDQHAGHCDANWQHSTLIFG